MQYSWSYGSSNKAHFWRENVISYAILIQQRWAFLSICNSANTARVVMKFYTLMFSTTGSIFCEENFCLGPPGNELFKGQECHFLNFWGQKAPNWGVGKFFEKYTNISIGTQEHV